MNDVKPVILIILDGFGLSTISEGNAVLMAKTPCFDDLIKNYPTTSLKASGQEVGLEFGEMGNSEVGHLNLGTGRIIMQDLPRIDQTIENGLFFKNKEMLECSEIVKKNNSTLHLFGLVSRGGVHSHLNHLLALLDLAKQQNVKNVFIHIITDGRDTPPKQIQADLQILEKKIKEISLGKIVTICGRFYAMDRDKHWDDRTKLSYDLVTQGKGEKYNSVEEAINKIYSQKLSDENFTPSVIGDYNGIKDRDAMVFFNFRSDRAKQITQCLIDPVFDKFKRDKVIKDLFFVSFTNYGFEPTSKVKIAFFSNEIKNSLAETISANGSSQLHIAETEKYAHVTYFFNGGKESPFAKEERILVPSPRINSYDQKPEMSAKEICNKFLSFFESKKPSFTVINFANPDMVGHTGNLKATIKAIEIVDACLKEIISKLSGSDCQIIITADHGNAEQMIDPETKQIDKEHSTNPVPFIIIDNELLGKGKKLDKTTLASLPPAAVLSDVTTTVIDLLNVNKPGGMSGESLKNII